MPLLLLSMTYPNLAFSESQQQHVTSNDSRTPVRQYWSQGWDLFNEAPGHKSKVVWTHLQGSDDNNNDDDIRVKYVLKDVKPIHDYQVGMHFFYGNGDASHMPSCPDMFGQFKTFHGGVPPFDSGCDFATRQGERHWVQNIELGTLHTDKNGNGVFVTKIRDIAPGVYQVEFTVREGVGCYPPPEGGFAHCDVVFQSPGPFGKTTTITIK